MRIAVYYIATDAYKKFFPDFVMSLQDFFPNDEKIVMLITDGGELEKYENYRNGKVSVYLCPRINHYPWPIVTLYKQWHILQNWNDFADYVCYFNANAIVKPNTFNKTFNKEKLTVSYHSFNGKDHSYDPWYAINISQYSVAYQPNKTYSYIQGGFFFGPSNLVKHMCEDINKMVWDDTSRHLFAQWHDESYLNKWCTNHLSKVDKKYIMSVYPNAIDNDTFVFLRDKGELVNDIKVKNINH